MKKQQTLMITMVALLLTNGAQAAIIASWDAWADGTATGDADSVLTGFTATADSQGVDRALSTFTSNDGTFGTVAGADTTNTAGALLRFNGPNILTITLNNNTGSDYTISSLHFDFSRRGTSPDEIVIDYVSGGLGPAATTIATESSISWDGVYTAGAADYQDFDYNLAPALSDTTLADGESATFTFTFNNGSGNNSSVIDNLAFQGDVAAAVVPEPSSAILSGLGILLLLRRRRD